MARRLRIEYEGALYHVMNRGLDWRLLYKNERDFDAPIVSVSPVLSKTYQLGGMERSDKVERIGLAHGDVLVWGGPARLRFHGVLPLKAGHHALVGPHRINLTFRKAS